MAKTHDTKKVHHIVSRINDGPDVRRTIKLAYLKETYANTNLNDQSYTHFINTTADGVCYEDTRIYSERIS